jgi:hypothetical protein
VSFRAGVDTEAGDRTPVILSAVRHGTDRATPSLIFKKLATNVGLTSLRDFWPFSVSEKKTIYVANAHTFSCLPFMVLLAARETVSLNNQRIK